MNNQVILNLQLACTNSNGIPTSKKIKFWVQKIFSFYELKKIELTIRIVDVPEILYLNWHYLGNNYPTNVLSFPYALPAEVKSFLMGDIVICKDIVEYESKQNQIPKSEIHWAHIITHGSLHLLGYNHQFDEEATIMNQKELYMIQKFGYQTCCSLATIK